MKKKMIVLIAGALMALSTSSAFAYFSTGDLSLYAYSSVASSLEKGFDLGNIDTLLTAGNVTTITNTGLSTLKGTASNLYAGAFGISTSEKFYIIADKGKTMSSTDGSFGTIQTQANGIYNANYKFATEATYTVASGKGGSTAKTYFGMFDGGFNGNGQYKASVPTSVKGDFTTNLTTDVIKSIYSVDRSNPLNLTWIDTGATVAIKSSGDIVVTAAPATTTPIPAAAYLLGSGLLGLFGIRRKNA